MTREQIIANTKKGAERAASSGFAVTPRKPKAVKRFYELKARAEIDERHNEEEMVVALRA